MKAKRIVIVGSEGYSGVANIPWTTKDWPNIADYDNVILDTSTLTSFLVEVDRGKMPKEKYANFLRKLRTNQEFVRERLLHLLHSGGDIYAICSPKEYRSTSVYAGLTNYEWCPFSVRLVEEKGETIELKDVLFKQYFHFVRRWSFCFEELERNYSLLREIHDFYQGEYYVRPQMRVIAENRYTRPIAIALRYELYRFEDGIDLKKS